MPKKAKGDKKGRKSTKGDKKRKSSKRKSSKKSTAQSVIKIPSSHEPVKPAVAAAAPVCHEMIGPSPAAPCQYTPEACCKDAVACQPNRYPGLLSTPQAMAVVGSECGSYDSICKLLRAGFRCADRVFAMTPWGNYVVFRCHNNANRVFFLYDGCTCNVNRFRYFDLTWGTAGLLYFEELHCVISYIMDSKDMRMHWTKIRKSVIDDICKEFCDYGNRN